MPVYHIVLFKLKPGVTSDKIAQFKTEAVGMVGKIPGLQKLDVNPPDPVSANRAKGYDMGLVAVLDSPEYIMSYAKHPAHQNVHKFREELCDETLAYDMEFDA